MYFPITLIRCKWRKAEYFSPEHFSSHKKNDKSMALHQFAQVKTPGTAHGECCRPCLRKGVGGDSCPIWIRDRLEPGSPPPSALCTCTSPRWTLWGWWLHHVPAEPVPMLTLPFSKELFLKSNLQLSWITLRQFPLVVSISYLHACLKPKALHHVITGRAFIPWCHLLSNHRTPQGIPLPWQNISILNKRGIQDSLFHIIPFCSSILKFCWTHSCSWLISLLFN